MSTTYNFPDFDLSDDDYFDFEDRASWDEINKHIVYDFEEVYEELESNGFDEVTDDVEEAFRFGAEYAFRKVNEALKIAGVDAQICYIDLVEGSGYILTKVDEDAQDFVNRVLGNDTV